MKKSRAYHWRLYVLWGLLALALGAIIFRLLDLGFFNRDFLLRQSAARVLRVVKIPAYRGMITDRLDSPLAISTPMDSVWMNPKSFHASAAQFKQLAHLLQMSSYRLRKISREKKQFVYLRRRNPPQLIEKVRALSLPGVFFQREYKRYYPEGEVASHVVGLTNVDDCGQEGLELAFQDWLAGKPGKKEVIKDRLGHVVANVALLKAPRQGHNLQLSLDHRIQYLAYRQLKKVVNQYQAQSGSIIVLDVKTGEVLAMVNQPTYNPNQRANQHKSNFRNRAVTDMFEPGSTIKPFNIALALQSGRYMPDSVIDTSPGRLKVGGYVIRDHGKNYGEIDLTQVLQKSSNIGAAKIMLSLEPQLYWNLLRRFGFGVRTHSGFPGESPGSLSVHEVWYPSVVATLAYGYGIGTTAVQLAHAYAVLADAGVDHSVTFLKQDPKSGAPIPHKRVLSAVVAREVLDMLETVVQKGGTGVRARVPGYRVAGKTGTAYIAGPSGYDKHRYIASFVGVAPASRPRLVVAVVVRDPKKAHYGGVVAAPVFAAVMNGALRIRDITPDAI